VIRIRRAVLVLLAATALVYGVNRAVDPRHGLMATYRDGAGAQRDAALLIDVDSSPSTAIVKARRPDFETRPFSVEWRGFLTIARSGTYTFRTVSDDGSMVYVQGRPVVDNSGAHPVRAADGEIALERGTVPLVIQYTQEGGDATFELSWSRNGGPLEPVPTWMLTTDDVWYGRVLIGWVTNRVFPLLVTLAYIALAVVAIYWLFAAWTQLVWANPPGGFNRAIGAVLLLTTALAVWGIWWGLPNVRGWAPDEIVPADVLNLWNLRFSHGWGWKYPLFHYMLLAAADSPFLLLSWLGVIHLDPASPHVALMLIGRFVSVACALGIVAIIYRTGLELYGRRGAVFAALTTALTMPFAYHAGIATVDVPYVFWFAVSLLAYVRILKSHARRDYLVFAVSAVLAGCTKDQAWGLCALTPIAIFIARWQHARQSPQPMPIVNGTVVRALALGIATFLIANNVIFNFGGFVKHVRLVFSMPGTLQLNEFSRSIGGQLQMLWRALVEMRYMFGVPLAIIVSISVIRGIFRSRTRPALPWLLVPSISYYVVFLVAVLFIVDRYLLPITIVLSLFAGWWLERVVADGVRARRVRLALVWSAFAYSTVYAAASDYQMTIDSRYEITRWLKSNVQQGQVVGSLGPLEYVALAGGFEWESVDSIADVAWVKPAFIVIKAEQIPHSSEQVRTLHAALADGSAGYRLALRYRAPALPLPGLHPDLGPSPRLSVRDFSDFNFINPTLEIFERVR
jgi:PA14 domain/Dolichyl-phosphate-mannose-protein mannosyltransferase